jgi:twitching motility two-component system response regulator PilG
MKVLLVDDTKTLFALVQIYLMGCGLEFVVASDGLEGLAKARVEKPDLVVTDVRMPRMDGFELLAALRQDPALSKIPIVLLTSLDDEASREKGKLLGATAFLHKPVGPDALRATVQKILGLPEARR